MRNIFFRQLILSLALLIVPSFSICAQSRQGNRWLIVADTSLAMKQRGAATQTAVEMMLLSGMSGQLRPGDTIGMWSFNEQLRAGEFPLQVWTPESGRLIAARAGQFIKQQNYEKFARFDKIIPAINNLVTNSDVITVILITDGSEKISGTPYDDIINKALKQDYSHQKKLDQPFVVTFRGVGGKFSGFTVNPAPWPVSFTRLPPEPEPAVVKKTETVTTPETKPQPTAEPAPARVVQPLIISGNNIEPAPAVQAAKADETPLVVTTPEPAEQPVAATKEEPVPAVAVAVNPPAAVNPTPAPAVVEITPPPAPQIEATPQRDIAVVVASPKDDPSSAPAAMKEAVNPPVTPTPAVSAVTPREKPATEIAVVTTVGTDSGNQKTLLLGVGLLVVALGIGIFWLRRPRHAGQASLITRSLDKDKRDL